MTLGYKYDNAKTIVYRRIVLILKGIYLKKCELKSS
jgi:hypothetical protein